MGSLFRKLRARALEFVPQTPLQGQNHVRWDKNGGELVENQGELVQKQSVSAKYFYVSLQKLKNCERIGDEVMSFFRCQRKNLCRIRKNLR